MSKLTLQSVSKSFDGINAAEDLSFEVESGEITALIGPNGSGKTTVFNLISGYVKQDKGVVILDETPITGLPPHEIARLGVARTFQTIRLCSQMSVLDNTVLAMDHPCGESLWGALGAKRRVALEDRVNLEFARSLLEKVGMWEKREALGEELSHGQRRLVEITRALALRPSVVLLDEPMSGLYPTVVDRMIETIRDLRTQGITVFLIEHNMRVVKQMSDKVIVLNHGRRIAEGSVEHITTDPAVIDAYLGRRQHGTD